MAKATFQNKGRAKAIQMNAYKNMYRNGQISATKVTSKYCAAWLVLTLRKFGYGKKRLMDILDTYFSLVERMTRNEIDIEEILNHIHDVTGIRMRNDDTGSTYYTSDDGREFELLSVEDCLADDFTEVEEDEG